MIKKLYKMRKIKIKIKYIEKNYSMNHLQKLM